MESCGNGTSRFKVPKSDATRTRREKTILGAECEGNR